MTFLHDFGGQTSGPLQASDGNLYFSSNTGPRTCRQPDDVPCGSILRRTSAGVVSILHAFGETTADGYLPGDLIVGHDGAIFGMTQGGPFNGGTIFRLGLNGQFSVLHQFGQDARGPYGPVALVAASDGNFYGVTSYGGSNDCPQIPRDAPSCGTAFRMTPQGQVTVLANFGASASDGITPNSLMQASDGNLYGTTGNGGSGSCGTLFRLTLSGTRTTLKDFCQSSGDGSSPQFAPVQASDGNLYGLTVAGGDGRCGSLSGCGTVYRLSLGGTYTTIYRFAPENRLDGYGPNRLIVGRDGLLYGSTISGGTSQEDSTGTIFRMTLTGTKTILHNFAPIGFNVPGRPLGLIHHSDGSFMGTADWGRNGYGTLFRLTVQ